MTAKSSMHNSRMSSNNAMHTNLRLAHSLLSMWTLATVKWEHDGSDALQNLPVTIMPSTVHERRVPGRARDVPGHAREVASESTLVEEHGAMVLGDHVEVLHQRTLGDKAEPSCTQITCQGPLRCEATKLGPEPRAGLGCHDKICNLVCRAPIGLVGPQGRPGRPAEQAVVGS